MLTTRSGKQYPPLICNKINPVCKKKCICAITFEIAGIKPANCIEDTPEQMEQAFKNLQENPDTSLPSNQMTRTMSRRVEDMVYNPYAYVVPMMTRQSIKEIITYGISSCQLTRTFGLIIYALNYLPNIDLFQQIMKLFYPHTKISTVSTIPDYAHSELEHLRKMLTFGFLDELNNSYYKTVQVNENGNLNISLDRKDYLKILTFAIIIDIGDFQCPIHYFNVAFSLSMNAICCHSSWAADEIRVRWRKFVITPDMLTNITKLIDEMIDPSYVFYGNAANYKSNLFAKRDNLFIVELLRLDGRGPLVDSVEEILREFVPAISNIQTPTGGSINNKKRTKRKIYNRKSNKKRSKRTKKNRKTYKKR